MKKKMGTITILMICITSLFLFSACKKNRSDHHAFAFDYVSEVLDLTEQQDAKLKRYALEIETKAKPLKDKRVDALSLIKEQLTADNIDTQKVKNEIEAHRRSFDEIVELTVDRFADFHKDLTAEQKQKLVEKLEKFEKYHKRHHGA